MKGENLISTKINLVTQRVRESAVLTIFVAILILSLIGCAPATPIVITLPTTAAGIPTETITIPPTETPTPFPTQTPFNPRATVKIVVHVPLSGGGSREGTEIARAAELAAQQLAGPLNELGYAVELVQFDDQSDVEIGVANANEIVADPEILCGVGHINSNVMVQASEIYHLRNLAFISPSSTTTTVTDRVYPEVNRIIGRDDGQGMAGAQFAHSLGFTQGVRYSRYFILQRENCGLLHTRGISSGSKRGWHLCYRSDKKTS
jgi:branched-chain amino acid transport system substrate-binding protein